METFTWRKSIWDNNFKCTICGAKLTQKDGSPTDNVGMDKNDVDKGKGALWCMRCNNHLGYFEIVPDELKDIFGGKEGETTLMGNLTDFGKEIKKAKYNYEKATKRAKEIINEFEEIERKFESVSFQLKNQKAKNARLEQKIKTMEESHRKEVDELNKEINRIWHLKKEEIEDE